MISVMKPFFTAALKALESISQKAVRGSTSSDSQDENRETVHGKVIGRTLMKVRAPHEGKHWRGRFEDLLEELEEYIERQDDEYNHRRRQEEEYNDTNPGNTEDD